MNKILLLIIAAISNAHTYLMKAVLVSPQQTLSIVDNHPIPELVSDQHVLIQCKTFGLNRADIMQRLGKYPPPADAPKDIPGLECAGIIVQADSQQVFSAGDRVMALLSGGGYSEFVAVHKGSVIKIPDGIGFDTAAAIPENYLTSFGLLFLQGQVKDGDTIVVYAAGSGIGVSMIQLARILIPRVKIIAVAGQDRKLETAKELGADFAVNYKLDLEWSQKVKDFVGPSGVDVVFDCVGASFYRHTIDMLGMDSRWVLFGTMGGNEISNFNLSALMRKRIALISTTLRNRSVEFKEKLVNEFKNRALPLIADGKIQIIVDRIFPLNEITQAHEYMQADQNIGKIVVEL
jgi:putative PIG3 family NAD(P)H quinone oxidoreductase